MPISRAQLREQASVLLRVFIKVGLPVAGLFGAVYILARIAGVPFSSLSRDPAVTYSYPWYGGAVSHLGALIAVSAGLLSIVSSRISAHMRLADLRGYTLFLGIGLIVFGLDDLLVLHEGFFPSIGIPELAVVAIYPAGAVLLIFRYWHLITERTDFGLLAASLALLAAQGLMDLDSLPLPISRAATEDPLKIVALVLLLVYQARIFSALIESAFSKPGHH